MNKQFHMHRESFKPDVIDVTTGLKWNHFNRLKQNRSDLWAHYGASV
ncbi:MAG: hypothetical protein HOC09_17875 [Deltaproteobacteria bacterium]|nr:hypothetical protein [Deltaproteobacteria bacterium]